MYALDFIFKKFEINIGVFTQFLNIYFADSIVYNHAIPVKQLIFEYYFLQYKYVVTYPMLNADPHDVAIVL
jgi:hypothetical protein